MKLYIFSGNIENNSVKELKQTINEFGGWPIINDSWDESNYSWIETVYKIQDYGYPLLFPTSMHVSINPKNTNRKSINVNKK